eukprot:1730685-Prymnesium_polylepis.1
MMVPDDRAWSMACCCCPFRWLRSRSGSGGRRVRLGLLYADVGNRGTGEPGTNVTGQKTLATGYF